MWTKIPSRKIIDNTIKALKDNGFEVFFAENGKIAREKVLEIIPIGAEILASTSKTLDELKISDAIAKSDKYKDVRKEILGIDRKKPDWEQKTRELRSSPDWIIASVHALTQDGKALTASRTGSQIAGYSYGSSHVIWVVGAQKIVKDIAEGIKRIFEHSLLLESKRALEAYGVKSSRVNDILIVYGQDNPRITIIIIPEVLGF